MKKKLIAMFMSVARLAQELLPLLRQMRHRQQRLLRTAVRKRRKQKQRQLLT